MVLSLLGLVEYVGLANLLMAVFCSLLVCWFIRVNYWSSLYRLPPGPPVIPSPFNAIMALFPRTNRFGQLMQVSKRYGDMACIRLGSKIMILVNSPSIVRDLLVKQADVTSNRAIPPFFKLLMNYTGGIIFSQGEPWQEIRRFSLAALRNFGMGKKSIEYRIQEEARVLCAAITHHSGKPFDALHLLNAAVSNIICSITFGRRLDYDDPVFLDMIDRLRCLTTGSDMNAFVRELMIRFPVILKTSLMQTPRENINGVKDFISKEVRDHTETFDPSDIRDIIDTYLAELGRLEVSGEKGHLTRENIWTCVFDLFLAGTETTSSSLLWLLLFMAGEPDVQQKVIDEIDNVIGRERAPCVEDRKNMPYTEATLTEVLRFRPVAPMGVQHVAATDVEFRGYTIPQGAEILISILGIHLDPRFWDNPEVFNPDRFLSEDGKTVIKNDAFFVFGAGRRVCLGEQLARMEFFLFATTLLQRFRFTLPEGETPDYGFEHCFGTIVPKSYKVRAQER